MKKNRKRILSILMVFVLTISGLIAIAPVSGAESEGEGNDTKIRIDDLTWDKANQGFVVALSLKFGLATAGERAGFSVATTLNFDAGEHGGITISVPSGEESVHIEPEDATKDSDNFITIDPSFIPWDRNGGTFEGFVEVTVIIELSNPGVYSPIPSPTYRSESEPNVDFYISGGSPEICDNQIDDDGDGLIDCEDEDCTSSCPPPPPTD
jgi:hypothetical protein